MDHPKHEDAPAFAIAGELTVSTVSEIRERLLEAMREGAGIVVDLGGVEEIDTAGLQLMLMAKRGGGRPLRFVNHSEAVLRLLDLAGASRILGDPLLIGASANKA